MYRVIPICIAALAIYFLMSGGVNFFDASQKAQQYGLSPSPLGLISFKVVYGGLMLGVGLYLAGSVFKRAMWAGALWLGLAIKLAFFLTRIPAVIAWDQSTTGDMDALEAQIAWAVIELIEIVVIATLLIYHWMLNRERAPTA